MMLVLLASASLASAAQSMNLAWDVDTDPSVVGYRLHFGFINGQPTESLDVGSKTTATVPNLAPAQTYYFSVTAYNSAGLESLPSNEVAFTTNPAAPPPAPTPTVNGATTSSTLFSNSDVPSQPEWNESNPVELGVKFRTSVAGQVTGLRFYKWPNNTGNHVGNLWSAWGTLLATATFTNETASGWQQVNLSNPVTLLPGETYIASVHMDGFYAADPGYFVGGRANGPLTAPDSVKAGGNGVYSYGTSSQFPANTYNSTNYWVDLVFSKSPN
jgi:hypothetical protein